MSAPRVLVVDDSPTIRKLVEIALRGTEWSVAFAPSGKEAIASALSSPPEAILLDFVLPDMRGVDVCARLSREPATAHVPVLVMTAKEGAEVKALFAPYSQVFCWLPKPFTAQQLLERLSGVAIDPVEPGATFSLAQKERAARALFGHLKGAFAQIPSWLVHMGAQSPAAFFARKILTPDLMERLLGSLEPIFREALESGGESAPNEQAAGAGDASLQGRALGWPVAGLLSFVASSGRTGELRLTWDGPAGVVYFRRGEIVLVTSHDPDAYLNEAKIAGAPAAALERAREEQRRSAKPVPVTLAEMGHVAPVELPAIVHGRGRRILLDALDARTVSFAWKDLGALPTYVEAHGRHVSTTRETLTLGLSGATAPPPASSLDQLTLARLRNEPHTPLPARDAVFQRARGFSDHVRRFDLGSLERRVLALVDGRHDVGELAARAGASFDETGHVLWRLGEVGLVVGLNPGARPGRPRPVLILEPDVEGFQKPLETLLRSRPDPVSLVSLDGDADVVAAIQREHPRMVILNAAEGADDVVRAVRASGVGDVSLVALVDVTTGARTDELTAAGFDAVLVKPVPYAELERLIDA